MRVLADTLMLGVSGISSLAACILCGQDNVTTVVGSLGLDSGANILTQLVVG